MSVNTVEQSNSRFVTDDIPFIKMEGKVKIITRNPETNEVVDVYENNNSILLQIRPNIIKLLSGFGNVKITYDAGNGWELVPDTGIITGATGNVAVEVVPTTLPYISQIAFGTGLTPPTIYDTDLEVPISNGSKILAVAPTISADRLRTTFAVAVDKNELNGITITEAVLRTTDGTVVARALIGSYSKPPGMMFEFYWQIGFKEVV